MQFYLTTAFILTAVLLASCNKNEEIVNEERVAVTGVSLNEAVLSFTIGDPPKTLIATVMPDSATTKGVTWSSYAPAVATVADGVVTAVSAGTTTITATTKDGGFETLAIIYVREFPKMTIKTAKQGEVEIGLTANDEIFIDWGDGTAVEKHTHSGNYVVYRHNYPTAASRTITISGKVITRLYCYKNQITSLDIGAINTLREFSCWDNQLTSLDISKNSELRTLSCSDNKLTSLDISKNYELTKCDCANNQLTSLVVRTSSLTPYQLRELACSNNKLTDIDLSKYITLSRLDFRNNQLNAAALNALIGTLHSNTISGGKNIYINGNPGTDGFHRCGTTYRGWVVNCFIIKTN